MSIKIENLNQLPVVLKGEQMFFQSSELTETSNRSEKDRNDPHMWLEPAVLFAIQSLWKCNVLQTFRELFIAPLDFGKTKLNNLFAEKYSDILIILCSLGCLRSREIGGEHWKDPKSTHIRKV